MRIGELAGKTGASERSIRHYDAAGLLPSQRGDNGYRQFDSSAVAQVAWINQLTTEGFSIKQIARLWQMRQQLATDASQMALCLTLHRQKLQAVEQQIAALQQKRQRLLSKIQRFDPSFDSANLEQQQDEHNTPLTAAAPAAVSTA